MSKYKNSLILACVALVLTLLTAWPLGCGIVICLELRDVSFWLGAALMEFVLAGMVGFMAVTCWVFVWRIAQEAKQEGK